MIRGPALRFAVSGAAGAALALAVTAVGHELVGLPETSAFAAAAACLFVFHFFANALFVFHATPTPGTLGRYAAISLAFRLVEFALFTALDGLAGFHYAAAATMALATSAIFKFLAYRTLVFATPTRILHRGDEPLPRLRGFLRETALLALVAVSALATFYGLHHLGNQIPQAVTVEKLREAYRTQMLSTSGRRPTADGRQLQWLAGRDPFPDCRMLASVIVPSTSPVADMIAPKALAKTSAGHCRGLHRAVMTGYHAGLMHLKPRYWHGAKAIMAIGLGISDMFLLVGGIKTLTYFAYGLLAVVALACSKRLLYVLSPYIVFGFFLSAVPYYGGFAYSIPYLYAVLALTGLAVFVRRGTTASALGRLFFALGMASAYLFLLDGHLISLLPMATVILYFADQARPSLRDWSVLTARCLSLFTGGFALAMGANVAFKTPFIPGLVGNFLGAAANRMAVPTADGEGVLLGAAKALARSFHVGFSETSAAGNRTLAYAVFLASLGAALCSAALWARAWYRWRQARLPVGVVVVVAAAAMVVVRLLLVTQHTGSHVYHIGRYLFVPMALGWAMLIVTLLALRDGRSESWVRGAAPEPTQGCRHSAPDGRV